MPNRYGLAGETRRKLRAGRKAIVGALLAGIGAAITAAQNTDDGTTVGLGALVTALVSGAAIWWTSNVADDVD